MRFLKYTLIAVISFSAISATVFNDKYFEMIKNIEIFTTVYKELNTHYVDEIDPSQLMRVGIDAMVTSLDPYTNYYSESQVQSYRISTEGRYNGIGAVSKTIDDWITITEIIEDGPAHKAGIIVGDRIIAINGESTKDRTNEDVVQVVRGFPGSTLGLTISRNGVEKKIDLDRSDIQLKNVPYSGMVSDNIGYVTLTTFTANASANIAKEIKEMQKENENMDGLILDLRNNGGGLLREAIALSNLFIASGKEVVSTKGKVKDRDKSYKTVAEPLDANIPLVVLINKGSASASEIVSGTIQDYDRGVLMGQRSFGKGLVQNHREVGYNSRIKVTTSKYYIPSGRCIQATEYENGEPKDIDDSERTVFKTRNGRPVLDGGGVAPDVKLDIEDKAEIVEALQKDNWIFKYVNSYVAAHDSIGPAEEYSYTDYAGFESFLRQNEFEFVSGAEKELKEFKQEAKEETLEVAAQIDAIQQKIKQLQADDIQEFKTQIAELIEDEIVSRYYFETGRTKQKLEQDTEIDAAIALLNDQAKYLEILGGTK